MSQLNYIIFTIIGIIFVIPILYSNIFKTFKFIVVIIFIRLIIVLLNIPDTIIRTVIDAIMILLVLRIWIKPKLISNNNFILSGFYIFIIFTIIIMISALTNENQSILDIVSFYRHLLVSYCFFLFARNYRFKSNESTNLINLFILLFSIQITGGIYKFLFQAIDEKYVGLLSYSGGSLNAIFPLIAISFFYSLYCDRRKDIIYYFNLICAVFIAIIGVKRGFFIFLPILTILLFYFKHLIIVKRYVIIDKPLGFLLTVILAIVFLFLGTSLNPYLNKENKIGGSIDIYYAYNVAKSDNLGEIGDYKSGRLGGTLEIVNNRFSEFGLSTLFGEGAGIFVGKGNESSNIEEYNVTGFTVLPGFARHVIEIGIFGSIVVICFYLFFIIMIFKNINKISKVKKKFVVFLIATSITFLYDYILYSPVFFNDNFPNLIYFTFIGLVFNKSFNPIK